MRTTVRIDDDLLRELKKLARQQDALLTHLVNQAIRRGLEAGAKPKRVPKFRQETFAMGPPLVKLDKALALAAALEDEEIDWWKGRNACFQAMRSTPLESESCERRCEANRSF